MSNVHIHAPQPTERRAVVQACPTCECRRRMLAEFTPWYGWLVTCLTCGEAWQDGEQLPRPFARGWRARSVTSAKRRMTRIALLALALVVAGCSHGAPTRTLAQAEPAPGTYADSSGSTLVYWDSGTVNVTTRSFALLPYTASGPCGQRDVRSVVATAAFRGRYTGGSAVSGDLCAFSCADTDIAASGTFSAEWTGAEWEVETSVMASDGCRSAMATTTFTAR